MEQNIRKRNQVEPTQTETPKKSKTGGANGPWRASACINTSIRIDYQRDICKDYKQTGFCGYGGSCKFSHDRGDYESGWQLEKEWEEKERDEERKRRLGLDEFRDSEQTEAEEVDNKHACSICKKPFVVHVVTKCKHHFCLRCALKHDQKKKKCFVCHKPTNGSFIPFDAVFKRGKRRHGC
ncbi:zinc finger CCCH domain-containing protein 15-like [Rosa sericea]